MVANAALYIEERAFAEVCCGSSCDNIDEERRAGVKEISEQIILMPRVFFARDYLFLYLKNQFK